MSANKTPKDKSNCLITDYINNETNVTLKHPSSALSPPETEQDQKKLNMNLNDNLDMDVQMVKKNVTGSADTIPMTVQSILALILSELQQLRETVHSDYKKLHSDYTRLEEVIMKRSTDVETTLTSKIHENTEKILSIAAENVKLKKENTELRDRLSSIETQQLQNNIIINGVAETKWGPYEVTKTRVYETIASALPIGDQKLAMDEALKVDLVCCSRIGRYQMNRARAISVMLSKCDDKEIIMRNKRNLLNGIFINDEYPMEVRRNRDKLWPILRLAKSLPHY